MKHHLTLLLLLLTLFSFSQVREEVVDLSFKPVRDGGYYFVKTEKTDSGFHRQAWYLSQKAKYLDGWYKDMACSIPHGPFLWFHNNGLPKEVGSYRNGKKQGVWMRFDEQGELQDSSNYVNGMRKGIALSWHKNSFLSDSQNFDGAGNGVQVSWYDDGALSAAGYWKQDTLKLGRWKYYHQNGALKATEEYDDQGRITVCNCFDEKAVALDTALCREKESKVEKQRWRRFMEESLQPLIEQKAKEGLVGDFSVAVRFTVNEDGRISDVKALTNHGYGIEEEVVNIFKNAPLWTPGSRHGRKVRNVHTQPVSFVIR